MANPIAHFSLNANDVSRASRFYSAVFGWKFHPYGPPGFFMIDFGTVDPPRPLLGSLQGRREIVAGVPMYGAEATVAVANVLATQAAILANGGEIVMPIVTLPGIGQLLFFRDPEQNILGAMQYESRPS